MELTFRPQDMWIFTNPGEAKAVFFYFELTCNGVVWSAFRPRPAYFWRHNNTLQDDLLPPRR